MSESANGAAGVRELLPPDTSLAFEAMRALRTQLPDRSTFATLVDELQRPQGYRLVAVFEQGGVDAVAVGGFRVSHSLSWGRFLYVDDLSTIAAARRRGHGLRLLRWLQEEASRQGCDQFHLDSGVGPERVDAHRLYFNAGLQITAHHFSQQI